MEILVDFYENGVTCRFVVEYLLNSAMLPIFGREEGSKCFI